MKTSMMVGGMLTAALIAFSGVAFAAAPPPTPCNGTLAGGTYPSIVVVTGDSCVIPGGAGGTIIGGNVTVQAGASLQINAVTGSVVIHGSVKGLAGCDYVQVFNQSSGNIIAVGGNLDIASCGNGTANACAGGIGLSLGIIPVSIGGKMTCANSTGGSACDAFFCNITGDLACSGNSGGCSVIGSTIAGNATLNNNSGGALIDNSVLAGNVTVQNNSGGATVSDSIITGNLTCANTGGTTQGGNLVAGSISCF